MNRRLRNNSQGGTFVIGKLLLGIAIIIAFPFLGYLLVELVFIILSIILSLIALIFSVLCFIISLILL